MKDFSYFTFFFLLHYVIEGIWQFFIKKSKWEAINQHNWRQI
jgi:hypothetical protein